MLLGSPCVRSFFAQLQMGHGVVDVSRLSALAEASLRYPAGQPRFPTLFPASVCHQSAESADERRNPFAATHARLVKDGVGGYRP
jgi:hypothetical protein